MAGSRFAQDSFVAGVEGGVLVPKIGAFVDVFVDEGATTLAAITNPDGTAIAGSRLTADADSQLPEFIGPANTTVLYGRLAGATRTFKIHARPVLGIPPAAQIVTTLPDPTLYAPGSLVFVEDERYTYMALKHATAGMFWSQMTSRMPDAPGGYARAVKADAPVCYWRLDDAANSTTAADSGSAALTGSVVNGATFGQPKLFPGGASCVYLNGADQYINVPHHTALSLLTTSYTVEGWWKMEDFAVHRAFVSKQTGSGSNPLDMWTQGTPQIYLGNTLFAAATHTAGELFHFAMTRDQASGALSMYKNGVLTHSHTMTTATLPDDLKPLRIGSRDDLVTKHKGWVSDVALYDKALTTTQIKAHYDAGINA